MPARKSSKKPPAAPRRKRVLHALYMAQPLLQFAALMAVLFVLGRCSPLASSTEKSALKKTSDNGVVATPHTEQGQNQALEEDIRKSLRDLNEPEELALASEKEFAQSSRESLHGDRPADTDRVKFVFQSRRPRLLVLPLNAEEKAAFAQGALRLDLARRLAPQMNAETQKFYFGLLHRQSKRLQARAFLLLPHEQMQGPDAIASLPVRHRFQLGFVSDDKAFLSVARADEQLDDSQQELIRSNFARATGLVVVLE